MGKQSWKAGNMLNPVPAVMVSVADQNHRPNMGGAGTKVGLSDPVVLSGNAIAQRIKATLVRFVLIHQGIIIIGQHPAHQVVHVFAPFGMFRHSTQNGGIQLLHFPVSLFFKQSGIMAGIVP